MFLFIGFSEAEENLLNPYTHLSVTDTIPGLQYLLEEAAIRVNEVGIYQFKRIMFFFKSSTIIILYNLLIITNVWH